ncbi:NADH-quinone oxidoreductase subunit N [Helicobacter ailurogastricus]|uniref:NADH-quinone oxidoreductase subunit N n=1 Tax=Helicobacter ailurogastricus TaxID=1578720 RepID=UPI000CF1635D|nr:NADH-quinone oxidoreductase subunit N [Helicobacter ailurogastricus]GMB90684.1 NADH-quinone oxidoreductase subunit N [Helicobacter ailurogastricus]GMB91328.1 NADH-quinone oxidoreductase subunit N [Helicobacter ailurogastricus]
MNPLISSLMPELDLQTLMPLFMSVGGGIFLLLLNVGRGFSKSLSVAIAGLILAFSVLWIAFYNPPTDSIGDFLTDGASLSGQLFIALASLLLLLLALSKEKFSEFETPEFYPLYLFMVAGFLLMVSTDHLLLILLGLESASLAMCVLMAINHKSTGIEAAIKYFTMSVLAGVFFVLGVALLYLLTGHLDLSAVGDGLRSVFFHHEPKVLPLFFIALACMLGALGFKVSLVPFHTWMPDIYEGNSPVFAGFISIVPKMAGLVVILRVLYAFMNTESFAIENLYTALIALTITIPNAMALLQKDVKRMMAYSSISHTGFALACVLQGAGALFSYWLLFLITNIGAFAILWIITNQEDARQDGYAYPYERFNGLIQTKPLLAILSAIFLCSLAGIPPFSMFWGKVLVLEQVIGQHQVFLPIVMVLNSAVSAVYYLRLLVAMFFKAPSANPPIAANATPALYAVSTAMAFLCAFSVFVLQFYLNSNQA